MPKLQFFFHHQQLFTAIVNYRYTWLTTECFSILRNLSLLHLSSQHQYFSRLPSHFSNQLETPITAFILGDIWVKHYCQTLAFYRPRHENLLHYNQSKIGIINHTTRCRKNMLLFQAHLVHFVKREQHWGFILFKFCLQAIAGNRRKHWISLILQFSPSLSVLLRLYFLYKASSLTPFYKYIYRWNSEY